MKVEKTDHDTITITLETLCGADFMYYLLNLPLSRSIEECCKQDNIDSVPLMDFKRELWRTFDEHHKTAYGER